MLHFKDFACNIRKALTELTFSNLLITNTGVRNIINNGYNALQCSSVMALIFCMLAN